MRRASLGAFLITSILVAIPVYAQEFNINDLNIDQRVDNSYRSDQQEEASQQAAQQLKDANAKLAAAQTNYNEAKKKTLGPQLTVNALMNLKYVDLIEKRQAAATAHTENSTGNQEALSSATEKLNTAQSNLDVALKKLNGFRDREKAAANEVDARTRDQEIAKTNAESTPPTYNNIAILKYNLTDIYNYVTSSESRTHASEADYDWAVPGEKPSDSRTVHLIPSFSWGYMTTHGPSNNSIANVFAGGLQAYDVVKVHDVEGLQLQFSLSLKYKSNNAVKLATARDSDLNSETYEAAPNIAISYQPCKEWLLIFSPIYAYDYNSMNSRGDTSLGTFTLTNIDQYTVFDNTDATGQGDKLVVRPQFSFNSNTDVKTAVGMPRLYENWATVGLGINYQASSRWLIRTSYLYDAFNSSFQEQRALVEADYSF